MEEHAIVYTQNYQQFKAELDHELNKAANSFVRIGYLLKQARDTDILKESQYTSYTEFAKAEYHLEESQVSRFIAISERFSKEDNPEELKDEFQGYGVAKLGIMLTLPDHINEELSPEMSKAEIAAVAEEVKEEQKITPIERMTEDKDETAEMGYLESILYHLGKNPENAKMMAEILLEEGFTLQPNEDRIMKTMAPAGAKLYTVRIPVVGRVTLNVRNGFATATNMISGERQEFGKNDVGEALSALMDRAIERTDAEIADGKKMWERIYEDQFPENAPVQSKAKVSVSKPAKSTGKTTEGTSGDKKGTLGTEKGTLGTEKGTKEDTSEDMNTPEDAIPAAEELPESSGIGKDTLRGYKAGLTSDCHAMERMIRDNEFKAARTKLQSMLQIVGRIIEAMEEE